MNFIGGDVEDAVCRSVDPAMWFPDKGEGSAQAIAMCAHCPLVEPCLDYALYNTVKGVWGGTNEAQRRRIQRARGITPAHLEFDHGAA
jgi:WhiB family transcriptional regulator, redox-sensing transcriptional regulator